ncbi:thioesterase family protein [Futiania mangrovi]|uniref:Thioesterase family protein n=1 Tax=Futiania mangrovi TaxID=2959716 RepID=A0A9J6PJE2_9PROT|nr:thioesterase family protein [Futiania mangrovii]MCP1337936.1 thioesterase family protein [Futiania mangrovii]
MSNWHYDIETAVSAAGEDRWAAAVTPHWSIGGNPNGGYLAGIALNAMAQVTGRDFPATVTTHYLRPGLAEKPAEVRTSLVRAGRRMATATATLHQDGQERIRLMAGFADAAQFGADSGGPELTIPRPDDLPPPEACSNRDSMAQGVDLAILKRLDIRVHPDFTDAGAAGRAEMAGWVRFRDGRAPDPLSLILFADAFPPSLYGLLGAVGWVPTVELTVQVRRVPAPGWIAGRFRTRDLHNGMLVEDGELWDETGALVARSRQLALLLTT